MEQLIKKTFRFPILDKILVYDQMTYMECMEWERFINKNNVSIRSWATTYLQEKLGLTDMEIKKVDLLAFHRVFLNTALRDYYSKSSGSTKKVAPTSSFIAWFSKEIGEPYYKRMREMTPEAVNYYCEGAIWNENEKTTKGREINSRKLNAMLVKDGDNEKDLEAIKMMREKKKSLQSNTGQGTT